MSRFSILAVAAVLILAAPAQAMIPSFGTQTAEGIRSAFDDSDFKLSFADGVQVDGGNFTFALIDIDTFPVIAAQDVQSSLALITLTPGGSEPPHVHPRAGETMVIMEGSIQSSFVFEGLADPRVVENTLVLGDAGVVPQGLVHWSVCVSETPCKYVGVLHSADGGFINVAGF